MFIHDADAVRFAELDRDEFSARSLASDSSDSLIRMHLIQFA